MRPRHRRMMVLGFCGLAAVAGFAVAGFRAARAPAVTEVRQSVPETVLTIKAGVEYDVSMGAGTSVWPEGARLEPDRALYTYTGKPVLHLRPFLTVTGPYSGRVTSLSLVTIDLVGATPLNLPLWSKPLVPPRNWMADEPLEGGDVTLEMEGPETALDVGQARDQARKIRDELGFIQSEDGMNITLTATVRATVNSRVHELPLQVTLPVHLKEDGFAPGLQNKSMQLVEAKGERVQSKQVPVSFFSRLLKQARWLGLGLFFGVAGTVLAFIRLRKPVPPLSPDHRRFKDWITVGRVGDHLGAAVEVLSLEGLVDLAIDLNKRVIHDTERNCYVVVDGAVLYVFRPEAGAL